MMEKQMGHFKYVTTNDLLVFLSASRSSRLSPLFLLLAVVLETFFFLPICSLVIFSVLTFHLTLYI